jgi:hypothetical protein
VLPTTLPLREFYEELVKTQQVMNMKHLGWRALRDTAGIVAGHLMRGQTNFLRGLFKFNSVFNPDLQMADHAQPVRYEMNPPPKAAQRANAKTPYLHPPQGRRSRTLDDATERFVDATRMGADAAGAD